MRTTHIGAITVVLLFLTASTVEYVAAQKVPRVSSQADEIAEGEEFTFRVRIQNIAKQSNPSTLFSPGVYVLHREADPLFTSGKVDRGAGLEMLAEDGDPSFLATSLRAKGLQAGVFDTPVCADTPGLLSSGATVEFGDSYEFEVTASAATPYISFASKLFQSNDVFLAPAGHGIALFDEDGAAVREKDVTDQVFLWDVGTEANEEPGASPNQAPKQANANSGSVDEETNVRRITEGTGFPVVKEVVKVYIVQVPMVDRSRINQVGIDPAHSVGDTFQVGRVQWRVLAAKHLGSQIKNGEGDFLFTDDRFVLVRFQILNLGSDPVELDGGSRNKRGVPLLDNQGREYPYFLVPETFGRDDPPREYVPEDEDCYGDYSWGRWRPFVLKPNIPTICSVFYEVKVDATGLGISVSELGNNRVDDSRVVDLGLPPIPRHSVGEYVQVGDVRWQILDVVDRSHTLESNGMTRKTAERFIEVRFQVTNKGSEKLEYDVIDNAVLKDRQGRQYGHFLIPRTGLPDRLPKEFIPNTEICTDLNLKPNESSICTGIFEVPVDATGLIFIAHDLGRRKAGGEMVLLGLPDVKRLSLYRFDEDVEVGDMCWRVHSFSEIGSTLTNAKGDTVSSTGRFVQLKFRILNMGSATLELDEAMLLDNKRRAYGHYHVDRPLMPDRHPSEFVSDDEECFHFQLEPNSPKYCTMIYEVANDAENFIFLASDLEEIEVVPVFLPNLIPSVESTVVHPGEYEVSKDIASGVYRGSVSEGEVCRWARLKALDNDPKSIIDVGLQEWQFYVEIQSSDVWFTTDCELVPLESIEPTIPLLASVSPGMYVIGLDIGPGQYKGEIVDGLPCFWQRLNDFREEDSSTIEWGLPGETYVVEIAPTDYAVDFHCPVEKVASSKKEEPTPFVIIPQDWQRIVDDRLGYSLAVPSGWQIFEFQKIEQHPLWSLFGTFFGEFAQGLEKYLASTWGENLGYLVVEIDRFPKPSVKSILLVGTAPLDDRMPSEVVIQLLYGAIDSIDLFSMDVHSLEPGITNNVPSIRGVASADLSSRGLFEAYVDITALRARDSAYVLAVLVPAKDAQEKQQLIEQVVGTFRPE